MKRRLTLALALVMLLSAFPAFSEAEETELLSIVKIEDDCVWIQTDKGLVPFSKEGNPIGETAYPGADCYAVADDGSVLYSQSGVIFAPDKNLEWETSQEALDEILVNDKYIVFRAEERIGRIERNTGGMFFIEENDALLDIEMYDTDSFLVLDRDGLLKRIDCATLRTVEQCSWNIQQHYYRGVAGVSNGIYLHDTKVVNRYEAFEAAAERCMTFGFFAYITDIKLYENEIYVLKRETGLEVHTIVSEDEAETRTLTIMGGTEIAGGDASRIGKAIEIFEDENPGYTVALKGMPKPEEMKTAIMAGEEGYDILVLDSTNMLEYKRAGICSDLSDNEVITENFSQYLDMPFLWELDGSIYGVPIYATPMSYVISKSIWETLELDISAEWTWQDVFDLADFAAENGMLLINGSAMWEWARRQYNCAYGADYTTDVFRNLAEGWKALSDANLVSEHNSDYTLLRSQYQLWAGDFLLNTEEVFLNFPMLAGKYVTPIDMTGFYANRHSPNADAAIRFLEIYSSKEVQKEYLDGKNGLFLPEPTEYTAYDSFWSLFKNGIPEEEEFERYKSALATGYLIQIDTEFEWVERQLFRQFEKGELTTDEFIAELQERADLMLGE